MTHTERLKAAIIGGDLQTVRESLSRRQVSDTFKDGRTLLHIASQNGKVEIVELLLQHGSRVSARDVNGYTPLHLAAARGHKEVIKMLLEFEAQVDDQDQFGNSSVHMAAWNGFSQSVKLLIEFHANINIQNKVGFTALHTAAQRGHNQSARELLYADAQVDAKNKYGETPLHTSTRHGHAGVTQILINANSNLNSKNKEGETSLHVSASLQRTKIARLLVEAGAKKSHKNKKGETVLDVACKNKSTEIVCLLQDASVVKEKRKKGLFGFLRRKATSSNNSRDQVLSLNPSLPSSVGSSKNLDQNQDRALSRAESFGEIRPERTGRDFGSLDRLGSGRRQRDDEMQTHEVPPPRRPLPAWNEPVARSPGDNPPNPEGLDYENFDPRRANPWGGYNFWHSTPGIVGAHGYSHVALYPQAYGFVPGYEAYGGPPMAGMAGVPPYLSNMPNRPGPSHGGLTNTIEQSMQYYRDLAGNLKQGPASANPAGPTPSNQARGLFNPGNHNFLFDVDTDRFLHRGPDIPAHHLYEPIGARGPDEPLLDDDDLWRAMHNARMRQRAGQHRSPPFSGCRRDADTVPLEPRVFIRNPTAPRAQGTGDEIPVRRRNYYPNHAIAERMSGNPSRDHFGSERSGERGWQRTIERAGPLGSRRSSHARPLGRSQSEETLSSVVGSSHERRRTEQRFTSRFRSVNLRDDGLESRGRSHRSNTIESGAITYRRGIRNFPNEIAHPSAVHRSHVWVNSRRNWNRSSERAVAMTTSLREQNENVENLDLGEDYRSESSDHEEANGEMNADPDRSLPSSDNDEGAGEEELPPLDDLIAGTASFNLEELEASPRKRQSPENSSPSEMQGSRNGASPQPSVETRRRSGDRPEYFLRDLGGFDTSSLRLEASLGSAEVSPLRWERPGSSGMNSTTRPALVGPGLESVPDMTARARERRAPKASVAGPSSRSEGSPFDVNRVTSV